jgi:hypothetical protein
MITEKKIYKYTTFTRTKVDEIVYIGTHTGFKRQVIRLGDLEVPGLIDTPGLKKDDLIEAEIKISLIKTRKSRKYLNSSSKRRDK